jgi:hypothetical protein
MFKCVLRLVSEGISSKRLRLDYSGERREKERERERERREKRRFTLGYSSKPCVLFDHKFQKNDKGNGEREGEGEQEQEEQEQKWLRWS